MLISHQISVPIIQSLNNIIKRHVPNLLQQVTFRHDTQNYLMINENLNFHPLMILVLKERNKNFY